MPGREAQGRFAARLDSIHTIQVPEEESARQVFVKQYRVYSLTPDFARDLHYRVFGSIASLGFDDYQWFAEEDLKWLVLEGQSDLQSKRALESTELANRQKQMAEGKKFDEKLLNKLQSDIHELIEALQPYQDELARRLGLGSGS